MLGEQHYDNSTDRHWEFDEMIVENDHLKHDDHKVSSTADHGVIRASFKWKPAPRARLLNMRCRGSVRFDMLALASVVSLAL